VSHWNYLQENDIIDVVAPGYPSQAHEVDGARDFLLKWKLTPRIPKGLIKPHFLHANDDQERFGFLKAAIESKDSQVIWCLRGGYGSNRLVPMLAKMKKPKEKKLLIGISDITSLHTFLIQEWGWSTLHAPLLDRLGRNLVAPKHEKELHRILFGADTNIDFKKMKPMNESAKQVRTIKSKIVGGNLTVLQSSLGTPWQVNADGAFLFIEDLGERGYRIDRMLEQFRQAGIFKKCKGLLLGDFLGGDEPSTGKNNFDLVFKRWAKDLNIPLYKGLEAGHATVQRPVPLNTNCLLQVEKSGKVQLRIETGGRTS
jgi:muramoyltetrapeptide carboxypeptidase